MGNKNQIKNRKQQENEIIKQIQLFSDELKYSGTIDFILSNEIGTAVLSVQEQYLANDNISEILGGHFKILGKVISICKEDTENIDLLRKTSLSILKKDLLDEMFSGFKTDDMKQFNLPELKKLKSNYNLLLNDLNKKSSWGIIDGKPVIIDYGFTKRIKERYY